MPIQMILIQCSSKSYRMNDCKNILNSNENWYELYIYIYLDYLKIVLSCPCEKNKVWEKFNVIQRKGLTVDFACFMKDLIRNKLLFFFYFLGYFSPSQNSQLKQRDYCSVKLTSNTCTDIIYRFNMENSGPFPMLIYMLLAIVVLIESYRGSNGS